MQMQVCADTHPFAFEARGRAQQGSSLLQARTFWRVQPPQGRLWGPAVAPEKREKMPARLRRHVGSTASPGLQVEASMHTQDAPCLAPARSPLWAPMGPL